MVKRTKLNSKKGVVWNTLIQTQQLLVRLIRKRFPTSCSTSKTKTSWSCIFSGSETPQGLHRRVVKLRSATKKRLTSVLYHYYQHLIDMAISSSLNYIFSHQLFLFQVQENQMRIKGTSDKEEICFNFINTKLSLDENTRKYKPEFCKLPNRQRLG